MLVDLTEERLAELLRMQRQLLRISDFGPAAKRIYAALAAEQQPDVLKELEEWCLNMGTMYKIEIDSDYSPNKFRMSVYWPSYQFTVSGNNLKDAILIALARAREQEGKP